MIATLYYQSQICELLPIYRILHIWTPYAYFLFVNMKKPRAG